MQRDLVIRAQAGDVDAFSALTAGQTRRLYAAAWLILRHDEQAADAVQDALLLAWCDLRGLRDPDRFDAWLHRLLVRTCYRAARRRRDREIVELKVAFSREPATLDAQRAVAPPPRSTTPAPAPSPGPGRWRRRASTMRRSSSRTAASS